MANDAILESSDLKENPGYGRPFFSSASTSADRSSGEAVLEYYIDSTANAETLGQGSTVTSLASSFSEKAYINSTIEYIDQWIDLDLGERSDPLGSYLDIYKVEAVDGVHDNVAGEVQLVSGPYVELQWEDEGNPEQLSFWEKRVITHELAHVFGLMHPNGDGPNPYFDSADTSLSYNNYPADWSYKLTAMDILAMIELWGLENDPLGLGSSGDSAANQINISPSGLAGDEYASVQRIEAGAGDDVFITDLRFAQSRQSGSILLGSAGDDLARFLLPGSGSSNPLLWLDLYSSNALGMSILQTTLADGDYHFAITDSERIQFNFNASSSEEAVSFTGGTSYGRMSYADLISRTLPISSVPSVPASSVASGGGGGGGGGGGSTTPASTQPPPSRSEPANIPTVASPSPGVNADSASGSVLIGLNSADPLIGDTGANTLIGGSGVYTLSGGAGADEFVFSSRERFNPSTADRITDFNPSEGDRIVLSSAAFQGLDRINFRQASSVRKLNQLSRSRVNLIYSTADKGLYFDANGSRKGFGVDGGVFAILDNGARPDGNSFIIDYGV